MLGSSAEDLIVESLTQTDESDARIVLKHGLPEKDWKKLFQNYYQKQIVEKCGEITLPHFPFEEGEREKIDHLNRLVETNPSFVPQIDSLERLARMAEWERVKLKAEDLKEVLKILRKKSGFETRLFDVEINPTDRENPVFRAVQLLRMNLECFKLREDRSNLGEWNKINKELNDILGKDFHGNESLESSWRELFDEVRHDALALGFVIGFVYFVLSYALSDPLRKQDKIVGKNARRVADSIWTKNPWFKGRKARHAKQLLGQVMVPGKEMSEVEKVRLKTFRSSLSDKEKALFDLVRLIASDSPVRARRSLKFRLLHLMPFLGILLVGDARPLRERQAMNRELEGLAGSIDQMTSPKNFYLELAATLGRYASSGGSMAPPIPAFSEISEKIIAERKQIGVVFIPPAQARSLRPNGSPSSQHGQGEDFLDNRPYGPGDERRSINWRVTARHDKVFVKSHPREVMKPAGLLIDMRSALDPSTSQVLAEDIARSFAALFDKRRVRGEKHLTLNRLLFLMPDDTVEMEIISSSGSGGQALLQALESKYGKAIEMKQAGIGTSGYDRRFYNGDENRRYADRAEGTLGQSVVLAHELKNRLLGARGWQNQEVFFCGVPEDQREGIASIFSHYHSRCLSWDDNIARQITAGARLTEGRLEVKSPRLEVTPTQDFLKSLKGLSPNDQTLLDSIIRWYAQERGKCLAVQGDGAPFEFNSGILRLSFQERGGRHFLEMYGRDPGKPLEAIDITDRMRLTSLPAFGSTRSSGDISLTDDQHKMTEAVEQFAKMDALAVNYLQSVSWDPKTKVVIQVALKKNAPQGLRMLVQRSAEKVMAQSRGAIQIELRTAGERWTSAQYPEGVNTSRASLAGFSQEKFVVGNQPALFWDDKDPESMFVYSLDMVIAAIVAGKAFHELSGLEKNLIRTRLEITDEKQLLLLFEAMKRGERKPLLPPVGRVPFEQWLAAARLATAAAVSA